MVIFERSCTCRFLTLSNSLVQLSSILIRVAPSAQKLSVDYNEEKRKWIAITQHTESLDTQVKELEKTLAVAEEAGEKGD